MNAYNAAISYLRNKFGYHKASLTSAGIEKHRKCTNKEQRDEVMSDEYNFHLTTNEIPEDDYESKRIELLLKQYSFGIEPKKELETALFELGVDFEPLY